MTGLPWTFSSDDPAGPELENRLQDVFDFITTSGVDTGGRTLKMRAGSGTITWPGASTLSSTTVVSHGLGTSPVSVVVVTDGAGCTLFPSIGATTFTASQFSARASTVDGQTPAGGTTTTFYWLAVG